MKKRLFSVSLFIIFAASSCATRSIQQDGRALASNEYECHFEELVDAEVIKFVLFPDAPKLMISSAKLGNEVIYLEPDNFLSGGFSFVRDLSKDTSSWELKKLEFKTYSAIASVKIDFRRTPSSKALIISKSCTE